MKGLQNSKTEYPLRFLQTCKQVCCRFKMLYFHKWNHFNEPGIFVFKRLTTGLAK